MDYEKYMRAAIVLAQKAATAGDVPVGCVVVNELGKIIGKGYNTRECDHLATSHAEIMAINAACENKGDWRLDGCTILVTLEPCPMCAGAIINARLSTVVYGAREPVYGSCSSVINLFEERYPVHPAIYGGILETQCAQLLSDFFEERRLARGN